MGKHLKKIFFFTSAAAAGMYTLNRIVDYTAGMKDLLKTDDGETYHWKQGDIFYTKSGSGSPLLLVHDLNPASSNMEWDKIIRKLEKNYTVYAIDLLGCGRSEKPGITYTSFLYVQLINQFIQDVIGEAANIVVTGTSASFVIMAQAMAPDNFHNIILINPDSIQTLKSSPEREHKIAKRLLEIPILGTFLYNLQMHEKKIHSFFEKKYFLKKSLISSKMEDIYFESAHKGKSAGKFLLASAQGNYINVDVSNSVKNANNLFIIASRERKDSVSITEEYVRLNKNIEISYLSNSKYLPQLEVPDKLLGILCMFLGS